MIKWLTHPANSEHPILILGLSDGNLGELKKDRPIIFDAEELLPEHPADIVIMWLHHDGRDMQRQIALKLVLESQAQRANRPDRYGAVFTIDEAAASKMGSRNGFRLKTPIRGWSGDVMFIRGATEGDLRDTYAKAWYGRAQQ